MGYILPVRPNQYNEYERRINIKSKDPMHIEKSYPVLFAPRYYDIAKEYTAPIGDYIDMDEKINKQMVPPENVYAHLTGKGRNFNDSV